MKALGSSCERAKPQSIHHSCQAHLAGSIGNGSESIVKRKNSQPWVKQGFCAGLLLERIRRRRPIVAGLGKFLDDRRGLGAQWMLKHCLVIAGAGYTRLVSLRVCMQSNVAYSSLDVVPRSEPL